MWVVYMGGMIGGSGLASLTYLHGGGVVVLVGPWPHILGLRP